jgi:PAS domain S-box-containing protein
VARPRPAIVRYGAAIPLLGAAWWLTAQLPPVATRAPFALFFAAVTVLAVYGGLGPALFGIAVSALVSAHQFLPPLGSFAPGADGIVRLSVFAAVALLIGILSELRLRSERAERARREWSEVTLASIGDAVIVTDASGQVRSLNRVAADLTGWTQREARGRPLREVFDIVDERSREKVEDPIARVRREGRAIGLANHTVLLTRDGREVPIDDSGAPIRSEDGRIVGAVLVFRDIRERRAAERQQAELLASLRVAKHRAEAANRAKDEFLAVLSHELRSPLNAILGWTQLLRSGHSDAGELGHAVEVIERNARLQTRLIEDVLDVSRIVSGKLRLEREPVAPRRVVDGALEMGRNALVAKRLSVGVQGECEREVLGDPHRLQQVVWNLLSNAVKFTPAGGRIEILLRGDDSHCEISVRDTGRGIAPEFPPHVFDRFRQEDASSTRRYGGLGLGSPSCATWWRCTRERCRPRATGSTRAPSSRCGCPSPGPVALPSPTASRLARRRMPPSWPGSRCWWWTTRPTPGSSPRRCFAVRARPCAWPCPRPRPCVRSPRSAPRCSSRISRCPARTATP